MTSRRSRQTRTLEAPPRPPAARALSATLGLLPHPGQMCWLPQYELRSAPGSPGSPTHCENPLLPPADQAHTCPWL